MVYDMNTAVPAGWFEAPHGAFRANPLYKMVFPSAILEWRIPVYTAPVSEPISKQYLRESVAKQMEPIRAAFAPTNEWREAMLDRAAILGITDTSDARDTLRKIIHWEIAIALDPAISSEARALIERGKQEALEAAKNCPLDAHCTESHMRQRDANRASIIAAIEKVTT